MKPVDVVGIHLEVSSGSPVLVLREQDPPRRVLPLFIGPVEAVAIARAVNGELPPRPLTHDLLAALVANLDAHIDHVTVTDLRDGAFIAELAVTGPAGQLLVDSRPSDAIALAVRVDAPLFVAEAVLDESGALLELSEDPEIDDEVDRFRTFLSEVDPSEFDPGPEAPPTPLEP